MSLKPKTGASGGGRKSPSQEGKFRKGADGKLKERCTCCEREGPDLPKGRTNATLCGLAALGHLEPNKEKWKKTGDLRLVPNFE